MQVNSQKYLVEKFCEGTIDPDLYIIIDHITGQKNKNTNFKYILLLIKYYINT